MTVNRLILMDHSVSDLDSSALIKKANQYKGVKIFDKMCTSVRGHLIAMPHFNINEMINSQKIFNGIVRAINLPRNIEYLKMLERVRDRLIIEELASDVNPMKFDDIETIYKDMNDNYPLKNRKLSGVIDDLSHGYIAIRF